MIGPNTGRFTGKMTKRPPTEAALIQITGARMAYMGSPTPTERGGCAKAIAVLIGLFLFVIAGAAVFFAATVGSSGLPQSDKVWSVIIVLVAGAAAVGWLVHIRRMK
jgi:hypothetical protein